MTLNGIRATGGAIQGPGPTIAGGMLYLNAGYGDHLGRAGNVLLAFEVQKRDPGDALKGVPSRNRTMEFEYR